MSVNKDPLKTPKPSYHHSVEKHQITSGGPDRQITSSNALNTIQSHSTGGSGACDTQAPVQAYAKLEGPEFCYYVRSLEVTLGRHPSKEQHDPVDIDLGASKAVSRRHAKIYYNFMNQCFELQVFGKNGCLIDDEYYERGHSIPLRHKMVIQIGDMEFTFLLPKSAMVSSSSAGTVVGNSSAAHESNAPSNNAMGTFGPPALHHNTLEPPGGAGSSSMGIPAQHDPYPVNAITPQRLNLYNPTRSDGSQAAGDVRQYRHQQDYSGPENYSPNASYKNVGNPPIPSQEPPKPLSFSDARRPDSPHDVYGSSQPHSISQQRPPHIRSPIHPTQPSSQQPQHTRQKPPHRIRPSTSQNASSSGYHGPSEIRILPSTQKPPSHESQYNNIVKPTYSYASLIAQAINSTAQKKITLNGIYNYIMTNYPYYKNAQNGWQNSIRHNLSLNKAFIKVLRASNEPGKGSYWAIDDAFKGQFSNGVYKRTRRTKKAMQQEQERAQSQNSSTPSPYSGKQQSDGNGNVNSKSSESKGHESRGSSQETSHTEGNASSTRAKSASRTINSTHSESRSPNQRSLLTEQNNDSERTSPNHSDVPREASKSPMHVSSGEKRRTPDDTSDDSNANSGSIYNEGSRDRYRPNKRLGVTTLSNTEDSGSYESPSHSNKESAISRAGTPRNDPAFHNIAGPSGVSQISTRHSTRNGAVVNRRSTTHKSTSAQSSAPSVSS